MKARSELIKLTISLGIALVSFISDTILYLYYYLRKFRWGFLLLLLCESNVNSKFGVRPLRLDFDKRINETTVESVLLETGDLLPNHAR